MTAPGWIGIIKKIPGGTGLRVKQGKFKTLPAI